LKKVRLYGEAGISAWLNGDLLEAIALLEDGYDILTKSFEDIDNYKAAVIWYGSTAKYIVDIVMYGKPPTEALGGPYAIPSRGDFYRDAAPTLQKGFYFDERRFIVAFVFQEAHEYHNEFSKAKLWAFKTFQIAMGITNPQYLVVLTKNLFYLVADGDFDHVFVVFNFVNQFIPSEPRANIDGWNADDAAKKDQIAQNLRSDDFIFYEYVLIPITYKIVLDLMEGITNLKDIGDILTRLFSSPNLKVIDADAIEFAKDLLAKVLVQRASWIEISELMSSYAGKFAEQMFVMAHIAYSATGLSKQIAELQLQYIQRQEIVFGALNKGGLSQFLIPFYENYWVVRFRLLPDEFPSQEFWIAKSQPRFQNAAVTDKLRWLFGVLVHHFEISTSAAVDNWLE